MDADARRRPGRSRPDRAFPLLGLVLVLVLAAALLHVPTARVPLFYDILGYTSQAQSLLSGHGNTVRVGDAYLPGYYPAGLSLLVAVPYALLGPDMRLGVLTILACALAGVLAVHALARRVGGAWAGLAAVLLLLGSPMFRQMSGYIMTQVPTGALIVVTVLLFVRRDAPGALFGAGMLSVASLLLRFANVTFPVALGCAALAAGRPWRSRAHGGEGWRPLIALGAGFAAGGLIVLAHNAWAYGDPFSTGYALWSHDLENRFALGNILWPEGAPQRPEERWVLMKAFLGLSPVQSLPTVVCAAVGLAVCLRGSRRDPAARRLVIALAFTLGLQYLFLAMYSFRSDNYLLPGVPLTAAVAGIGLARMVPARAAALAPALAAAALAWSVAQAEPPPPSEAQAVEHHDSLLAAGALLEPDAAVITAADPGLAEPLLRRDGGRRVLYVGPFVSPLVERAALVELGDDSMRPEAVVAWALRQTRAGRVVYLDQNPPPRGITSDHVRVRQGLHERFVFESTDARHVFRLVPKRRG